MVNWHSILIVGIGGFIGAVLRYIVSFSIQSSEQRFPFTTLLVNILGSFFLSVILFYSEEIGLMNDSVRTFLTIGVLGAFTTLSTFSYEAFKLLERKELFFFALYISLTIILSLVTIYLGKLLIQTLSNFITPFYVYSSRK
ncbi:MAG: fluoride efflux transporter CrcB [Asgard group archaeon]|nr:fluoride efflux transporter CrcB [Asgard group archaeon]